MTGEHLGVSPKSVERSPQLLRFDPNPLFLANSAFAMADDAFVLGVDYGTDSVRTVLINTRNGQELSSSVFYYPRWRDGLFCEPGINQFRQHPLDYLEGLEITVNDCLRKAGDAARKSVKGISIDTTGSTPVAVDKSGTPLALLPNFEKDPDAMFVLWKDHTSTKEAAEINAHATKFDVNYLQFVGGIYSSEWFWAKLLRTLRHSEKVRKHIYSWVEHCDWIPFVLTGGTSADEMRRGICSAGHKGLFANEFGGFPPDKFFASLDPLLAGFTSRLPNVAYTADKPAGRLGAEWSRKLGLSTDVVVGIGAFDAHMGAVGGQIEPYYLSKVMGTSTCDMLVAPANEMKGKLVRGICGQVDGSVVPGMIGLEAGQSAFGDTYAWFRKLLSWPLDQMLSTSSVISKEQADKLKQELAEKMIPELSKRAAALPLMDNSELSIDWLNGRRTPDANQELKAAITGLNLGSDAPQVFRALVEATCFGAKAIVDRFEAEHVPVKGLIGLGGVARRSPYIMQVMADVMGMPIRIHRSEQTCAAGAAMFAATAAGVFTKVEDAMGTMGQGFDAEYKPNAANQQYYRKRYEKFIKLGEFIERAS